MFPTFQENQVVKVSAHHAPKRFEVIVFQPKKEDEPMYLKRVIGLPGERIVYRKHQLYINGKKIKDPFANETEDFDWSSDQLEIPQGHYFVLGDNREISKDSRSFGLISKKQIKGIIKERN
ncbi:signal peptidase I [Enterococcus sp. 665A]|uniref:Signal peptidase I n=2 Tax=Candidatus Enterococcus ferrettii TaxID=2815324 RepID=A0ABV0EYF0_9ENTE